MPIYKKPNAKTSSATTTNENNDQNSEAVKAKMRRAREQAYFNSYNFDAIEVLPYDDNDKVLNDKNHHPKSKSNSNSNLNANLNQNKNSSFIEMRNANVVGGSNHHKHPQQHKSFPQHSQHQQHQQPFILHSGEKPLRLLATLSPKSQKRLHNASASSKSLSESSVPSTGSSYSDDSPQHPPQILSQHSNLSHHSQQQMQHQQHQQQQQTAHPQNHSSINIMNRFAASMPTNELKYLQHFASSSSSSVSSSSQDLTASASSQPTAPSAVTTTVGAAIQLASSLPTSSAASAPSLGHKRQRNDDVTARELVLDVRNALDLVDESFLLPRAMIKYHGVGSTTNSMPLAEIHNANGKFSQSVPPTSKQANTNFVMKTKTLSGQQGNSGFPSKPRSSSPAIESTTTTALVKSSTKEVIPAATAIATTTLNNQKLTHDQKTTTLGTNSDLNVEEVDTETTTATVAIASATNAIATTTIGKVDNVESPLGLAVLARTKKPSTSSTITTTTTTASIVSHDDDEELLALAAQKIASSKASGIDDGGEGDDEAEDHVVLHMGDDEEDEPDDDEDEDLKVLKSKNTLRPNLSRSTITSSSLSSSGEQVGHNRSQSHQSHYSTDKSGAGSSGYYSSNVCSTYSLDEHIYCEPVVDIINGKTKVSPATAETAMATATAESLAAKVKLRNELALAKHYQMPETKKALANVLDATSLTLEMQRLSLSKRKRASNKKTNVEKKNSNNNNDDDDDDDGEAADAGKAVAALVDKEEQKLQSFFINNNRNSHQQPYNESLRVLEASIENLDKHLKTFHHLNTQEEIVGFLASANEGGSFPLPVDLANEQQRLQKLLPTIMEGYDSSLRTAEQHWKQDIPDDSLLDIDLDSFLLVNEKTPNKLKEGFDNPGFLTDEQEENHYKCAKYINSCPEDAYHVDNDIGYAKRYEDQMHFQNTRELLEDVREKIRLLTKTRNAHTLNSKTLEGSSVPLSDEIPQELEGMIKTLKNELENYLERMNQHSELEIKQFCSGLTKNHHIVKMKKAFERRRSLQSNDTMEGDFSAYEAIRDGVFITSKGLPISVRHEITSIRCASDPNFKLKRKSISDVFPLSEVQAHMDEILPYSPPANEPKRKTSLPIANTTQLQRNLSFHKPVLSHLDAQLQHQMPEQAQHQHQHQHQQQARFESNQAKEHKADRDPLASWHRKKPSIWEMYYGTNRLNQSLLGGKKSHNGVTANSNSPATLSYPSSRPESDFTLDLPRAEQLRIKMEKEKKFRQRCRYITTFLSLVFFLLTVMVVSLVLTRGKRMFGSMI